MKNAIARFRNVLPTSILFASLMAMGAASTHAAEIRVFAGGAPQHALQAMNPAFEKQSGHRVTFTFAHVSVIQKRLAAGDQADVVLLPAPLMANVGKTIGLRPEGASVFARIGIGVLAREGQSAFDISTPDAVRKMLLAVRSIAVPEPGGLTGSHLMRMMTKLGIEDAVRPKLRHKPAVDGAGHLVAAGEADVGLYLVSEIQNIKGTTILGMLPAELQNYVTYSVAMPAYNKTPEPSASFIKFMMDPARQKYWKAIGFELVEAGK